MNVPKYKKLYKILNKINNIFEESSMIGSMFQYKGHAAFILLMSSLFFISGCSQDSYSLVNRTYHNTTAHYNAYFLAREKMKEIDGQIWQANVDDYNKVLKIYPNIDEGLKTTITPGLEEVIKKAALPVTKHKNSKWVDDSYILIGKSRLYQEDFTLALETFKFVNTKGADVNARHKALIYLMRTFIVTKDYDHANAVFDYLKKEKLNKDNSADFYVTRAYYYTIMEDYKKAEAYLTLAVKDISKKDFKARIHFIIAQINQLNENNKEAFTNYNQVLKNNPTYELSFYTKLYRTQVSELKDQDDKKKIENYFQKLLKDKKNVEYKDKIYYEMGMFDLKQDHVKPAVSLFKKSLLEKSINKYQKATTYLRLGKIYYENLQDYENAKLYYDSTVSVWDPKDKEFRIISQRQKVLEEFVNQLRIVQREDSLQRLAAMDSVSLDKFFDNLIAENEKKQKEEERRAKAAAEREERLKFNAANNNTADPGQQNMDNFGGQKWYFYNPTLMASGRTEFIKKWGNRPLEDNWRRAVKEKPTNADPSANEGSDSTVVAEKIIEKSPEEVKREIKQGFLGDIPFTEEQMMASNAKLEDGLYNLGKIYNLKLNERENAIATFEEYVSKFNEEENTPEVMYFLYLLYKDKPDEAKMNFYQEKIFERFPSSIFAKIIRNPNYLSEAKASNIQAAVMYKDAYQLYKDNEFYPADSMVKTIKSRYPENDIMDKLAFLEALIIGKTKNEVQYKANLESFITTYNTSDVLPLAKKYLAATDVFISDKTKSGSELDSNSIRYKNTIDGPHIFGAEFPSAVKVSEVFKLFERFHSNNYSKISFSVDSLTMNDSTYIVVVKEFADKNDAKRYLIEARNDKGLTSTYNDFKNALFVITPQNFELLKRSKYLKDYVKFYLDKYQ